MLAVALTAYNPASQIVTRTRSNAAYAFDDPEEGTTGYTDNALNQYSALTGAGAASLDYDDRGNLTSYNPSGTANDRAYAYNARNLMTSATLAGGSATTLGYDPLGRLFFVNAAGTTNDRRYLWDGDTIIAELNPTTGAIRRRFVHAPGSLGAPIAQYEGATVSASSRRYLQTDERGSVISAAESDDGTQAATNSYDPYGRPGAGNSGQFQYAGQLWLPETGTYYMRNRMYDPALGRFTQVDPIGYAGGINLYAYVRNDPTNFTDPLGLCFSGHRWDSALGRCVRIDAGPPSPFPEPVEHPPITVCGNCQPFPPFDRNSFSDLVRNIAFELASSANEAAFGPPDDQSEQNMTACLAGEVDFGGVSVTAIPVLGVSYTTGSFETAGGAFGDFSTISVGAGLDIGVSAEGGTAPSLSDFVGGADSISVSGFGFSGTRSIPLSGQAYSSGGGGAGSRLINSALGALGAVGLSGQYGETQISVRGCN